MGSYFAVDYDRAIGSWTILLLTFGYFRNPAHTQGDFLPRVRSIFGLAGIGFGRSS
ncbi:hypothetical protein [Microcoleus anatoxicus]|uniref:Uncharacterized protein n=1 Tax=Microcoleus anatoxicus PTRS2 TaxID=2705321 RepID=A0ABU8YKG9_9CYAN